MQDALEYVAEHYLSQIADRLKDFPEHREKVFRYRQKIGAPLSVAVIGEYSSGKSTFINALLGTPILPTGRLPTTGCINCIRYGQELEIVAYLMDGSRKFLTVETLRSFSAYGRDGSSSYNHFNQVKFIDVSYPAKILENTVLYDTPGLNAPKEPDRRVTEEAMASADVIVWVTSAQQVLNGSEVQALRQVETRYAGKSLCVISQADILDNPLMDIPILCKQAEKNIGGYFVDIVAISARKALEGDEEQIRPFYKSFWNNIGVQRKQLKASCMLQDTWNYLKEVFEIAAGDGDLRLIKALSELQGIDGKIDIRSETGERALKAAISCTQTDVTSWLIKKGVSPNVQDDSGKSALMSACAAGDSHLVDNLLRNGATLALSDASGRTALMYAAQNGKSEIVRRFLQAGADAEVTDDGGNTAADLADTSGGLDTLDLLLHKCSMCGGRPAEKVLPGLGYLCETHFLEKKRGEDFKRTTGTKPPAVTSDNFCCFKCGRDPATNLVDGKRYCNDCRPRQLSDYSTNPLSGDEIVNLLRSYVSHSGVYCRPNIPKHKAENADKRYPLPTNEKIHVLIDTTFWGGAANGVVFGANGIYFHSDRKNRIGRFLYNDLSNFKITVVSETDLKVGWLTIDAGIYIKSHVLKNMITALKDKIQQKTANRIRGIPQPSKSPGNYSCSVCGRDPGTTIISGKRYCNECRP